MAKGRKKVGERAEDKLTPEQKEAFINDEIDRKTLAEQTGIPPQTLSNIKHGKKLRSTFKLNLADKGITDNSEAAKSTEQRQQGATTLDKSGAEQTIQINYDEVIKAFWIGCDSMFALLAFISRGQIVYEKLTDEELKTLLAGTKNNKAVQKIASFGGLDSLLVIGTILMVFRKKFKFNMKAKHNKDDPLCKCRECEKKKKAEKEELEQIRKDAEVKQEVPQQMKPEQPQESGVIDYDAVARNDQLPANAGFTGERIGDGLILQKNVTSVENLPTPEEVIAKSGSKGMNQQQKVNISETRKNGKGFQW